jgi:hypothetical protein
MYKTMVAKHEEESLFLAYEVAQYRNMMYRVL